MKQFLLVAIILTVIVNSSHAHSKESDSLKLLLAASKEDTGKVEILRLLNVQYINVNLDTAISYSLEIISLSEKLAWHKGLWVGYHQTGYCQILKGAFSDAQDNLEKAIEICEQPDIHDINEGASAVKPSWKTMSLNCIGLVYSNMGNYKRALEYHLLSLKIAEQYNIKNARSTAIINIANIYNYQSDFKKALKYYFKALAIAEKEKDKDDMKICLGNIGAAYTGMLEYQKALEYYPESLRLAEETGDKNHVARCLNNIGLLYGRLHDYSKALEYFLKALQMAEELKNSTLQAAFMTSIGSLYIFTGKYPLAETYLLRALRLSRETGTLDYTLQIGIYLSSLYEKQHNYKEAFNHLSAAIAIKDTLYTQEKNNEINSKVLTYEFDKKQALLKAEKDVQIQKQKTLRNSFATIGGIIIFSSFASFRFYKRRRDAQQKQREAEQKEQETAAALRISEAELKNLRLQINPHFLNNTLQSIQQFISEHQPEEAEEYLENFSKLMRAVLEHSRYDEIPLSGELETLERYMQLENLRMQYPFQYTIDMEEGIDADHTFLPPNLLQPFVENAIKHGLWPKKEPGNIYIRIRKNNEDLHIIIEDDGVGRKNNNAVPQSAVLKHRSLGMKITEERLHILNKRRNSRAAFRIVDLFKNDTSSGTLVELSLPFDV